MGYQTQAVTRPPVLGANSRVNGLRVAFPFLSLRVYDTSISVSLVFFVLLFLCFVF